MHKNAHCTRTQNSSRQNTTKIHTTDSELNSILSILQETTKCCGFKFTKFIQFTFQLCVSLVTKQCSKTWRQKPCRRSFLTIILHAIEHHPKTKTTTTSLSNSESACVNSIPTEISDVFHSLMFINHLAFSITFVLLAMKLFNLQNVFPSFG